MRRPAASDAKKPVKPRPEFMPSKGIISKNHKTLGKVSGKIAKHYKEIFLEENKNLPKGKKKAILQDNVLIGMVRGEVIASRGSPYKINKTKSASGVYEQWVMYPSPGPIHSSGKDKEYGYIYFKNGKVTGWQSW